jgi:sarcosine/dimethylglycine N-methyltransferase
MQTDNCPEGMLQPILDRLLLEDMPSPAFYRDAAAHCGFREVEDEDLTPHLGTHYAKVLDAMEELFAREPDALDESYVERARKGLRNWVDGGRNGYLAWGAFHFQA